MKLRSILPALGLALLIGGCPKRQTNPRLVYLPAPPPPQQPQTAGASETLIIQEPEPPEPPAPSATTESPPSQPRVRRRPARPESALSSAPSVTEETEATTGELPALEPGGTAEQDARLRASLSGLQQGLALRLRSLKRDRLSREDRKTLEAANTFLAQSLKAFTDGDLPRAMNLARKAELLVTALMRQF